MNNKKKSLTHVIWVGGPPNSGKTTLAKCIAKMEGYQHYSYDKTGMKHLQRLAQVNTRHEKFIESVLDEQWGGYTSAEIADKALEISKERFQFVLEDIQALSNTVPIIAEGVGFTPEIIQPVMTSEYQGIWLIPTKEIMERSFRKKARFLKSRLGNRSETTINILLQANMHLMEIIKSQAEEYRYKMYEIKGTRSIEENVTNVWAHFSQYMNRCT